MSDANLDIVPSSERFRKHQERVKRTAKEYAAERAERMGDQVEKITEDMEKNARLSEILLYVQEHEKELKEQLGAKLEEAAGSLQNYDAKQWGELKQLFGKGQYALTARAGSDGRPEVALAMTLAEGNVQEKIPLKPSMQQEIIGQALRETAPPAEPGTKCPTCGQGTLVRRRNGTHGTLRCDRCGYVVQEGLP